MSRISRVSLNLLFLLVSIALLSCGVSAKNRNDHDSIPSTLAKTRLGSDYTSELNSSKTYVLFQQQRSADHALRKIKYMVVRLDDNTVLMEGIFQGGFVRWHDDESVEVLNTRSTGLEGEKKIINVNRKH